MVLYFLHSLPSPLHHIVIFGRHSPDWMAALGPKAAVWHTLPLPNRPIVSLLEDIRELRTFPRNTVVIPLLEAHTATWLQRGNPALATCLSPLATMHLFRDKAAFAQYVTTHRLDHYCPTRYHVPNTAEYPCVLKRTDLNAGDGVVYVASRAQLLHYLGELPWKNHPVVIQQHIPASAEYTVHGVCHNGGFVWHSAYRYDLEAATTIRSAPQPTHRHTLSQEHLRIFELFLRPVRYAGPVNIDFRISPEGAIKILEINPRLGGSLMRDENQHDLASALAWILRLARPTHAPRSAIEPRRATSP